MNGLGGANPDPGWQGGTVADYSVGPETREIMDSEIQQADLSRFQMLEYPPAALVEPFSHRATLSQRSRPLESQR